MACNGMAINMVSLLASIQFKTCTHSQFIALSGFSFEAIFSVHVHVHTLNSIYDIFDSVLIRARNAKQESSECIRPFQMKSCLLMLCKTK